jgi:hypothetical protein
MAGTKMQDAGGKVQENECLGHTIRLQSDYQTSVDE